MQSKLESLKVQFHKMNYSKDRIVRQNEINRLISEKEKQLKLKPNADLQKIREEYITKLEGLRNRVPHT